MRRFVGWCGALTLVALGACDSPGRLTAPEAPFRFGVPSSTTPASLVVGTWARSEVFLDTLGIPRTQETTWMFNADGTATRTIVTRSSLDPIVDRQDASALWELQGEEILIDFTAPFTGQLQLTFERLGDRLILGGQTFLRAL